MNRLLRTTLASLVLAALATACVTHAPVSPWADAKGAEDARARLLAAAAKADAPADVLVGAGWLTVAHGSPAAEADAFWTRATALAPDDAEAWIGRMETARGDGDADAVLAHAAGLFEHAGAHPLAAVGAWLLWEQVSQSPVIVSDTREKVAAWVNRPELTPEARSILRRLLMRLERLTGHLEAADKLEHGAGGPERWLAAGPFSPWHRLDTDQPTPAEQHGHLGGELKGPYGPIEPWLEPAPARMEHVPEDGDIFVLMADVTVAEGGPYLLHWSTELDVRVSIDEVGVVRRDSRDDAARDEGLVALELLPGTHRVRAIVVRDYLTEAPLILSLLAPDGMPAAATWSTENCKAPHTPPVASPLPSSVPGVDEPPPPPVALGAPIRTAAAWARARLDRDPHDLAARYLLGLDASFSSTESALASLEVVATARPEFLWAQTRLASYLRSDASLPESLRGAHASRVLDRVMPRADVATWRLGAELALSQERLDDAEDLVERLLAVRPEDPAISRLHARLLDAQGFSPLVRPELEAALARGRTSCALWHSLYNSRSMAEDIAATDAAVEALSTCGQSGLAQLGDHLANRGKAEDAEKIWRRLLALNPRSIGYHLRLVDSLVAEGRSDEAEAFLTRSLETMPWAHPLRRRLGNLHLARGDEAGGVALLEAVLAAVPDDLGTRRALAFLEDGRELGDWGALDLDQAIARHLAAEDPFATGADAVLVVDHAAVEVFAEDPHQPILVERIQTVTRVLTKDALDRHGQVQLPQGATLVRLAVKKPDGREFEAERGHGETPTSLPGLEPGDYVIADYLVGRGPRGIGLKGWTANGFYFRVFDLPLHRSSYTARAPAALGLTVEAHNLEVSPVRHEGDHLVFSHVTDASKALHAEPSSVDADEYLPWLRVGTGVGPEVYGDIWGDFLATRPRPSRRVRALAEAIRAEAGEGAERAALIRAAVEAVDARVRGTASPAQLTDRGDHVLAAGRGNRLTATAAVLDALGIDYRIALIRPFEADPSPYLFLAGDLYVYPVLRVELEPQRSPMWVDRGIAGLLPGRLRPSHGGWPALLLATPAQDTERVVTPKSSRDNEQKITRLDLKLDKSGTLTVKGEERYEGFAAAAMRLGLSRFDETQRRQAVEAGLSQLFGPISLDTLELEGAEEVVPAGTPLTMHFSFQVSRFARVEGERMRVPGGAFFPARLSRRLIRTADRTTPMLLNTEQTARLELTLALPRGYGLVTPDRDHVDLNTEIGHFERSLHRNQGEVRLEESLSLALTRVPPERYGEVIRFCAQVDETQDREWIIEPTRP